MNTTCIFCNKKCDFASVDSKWRHRIHNKLLAPGFRWHICCHCLGWNSTTNKMSAFQFNGYGYPSKFFKNVDDFAARINFTVKTTSVECVCHDPYHPFRDCTCDPTIETENVVMDIPIIADIQHNGFGLYDVDQLPTWLYQFLGGDDNKRITINSCVVVSKIPQF